ncbi:MAG TPA: response regulator [Anaeromyxobacteraceae bacterium]|nr:response regulator [Anaeromyxobacteraceae bacterium]
MPDADRVTLVATFERTVGDRLLAAERLAAWLPGILGGALESVDLGYSPATRTFVVFARTRGLTSQAEARFHYWCARAGGMPWNLATCRPEDRAMLEERSARCEVRSVEVPARSVPEAAARIANVAGAPPDRRSAADAQPTLSMDAGSAAFAAVTWDAVARHLFVPGVSAPPMGDVMNVLLRVPRMDRPLEARARVVEVRDEKDAAPGKPAGFGLAFDALPPILAAALATHATSATDPGIGSRVAPRYTVNAPVKVQAEEGPTARLEYANPEEFADDYVENLSQGGAFVRTSSPLPEGTRLTLDMRLPGGTQLRAPSTVMFRNPRGMGVKIELDEDGRQKLAAILARISARPRRALVVDDDALILRALTDSLQARGFEVLTAKDGQEGLHIVADELLTLDLLVTDVRMPAMDGETFVRTIRGAGGESELAIVVIAGTLDPALERRMETAGADAVLDKALGPEDLAAAADAALERKRLAPANG